MSENLRDATHKVAAQARRQLGPHPSPEELIAYQAGELSPADEVRLQDHLALCPDCTATVLDLASFPDVPLRSGASGPMKRLVLPWQNVEAKLRKEDRTSATVVGKGPWSWREKLLLGLAAMFLVTTLGLSYRLATFGSRSTAGDLARGDLHLFTLTAGAEDRTRGEERLPVSGERFNLLLYVANPGAHESYSLEAVSVRNPHTPVWRLAGLVPTPQGVFLVTGLSRRELPPGLYRLRLYGGPDLLAEYQVSIEYN